MQAVGPTEVDRLRFIARARLVVAIGVASSASCRDARWRSVVHALTELARELRWNVSATVLRVGDARAVSLVSDALAGVSALLRCREDEGFDRERVARLRAAINSVHAAVAMVEGVRGAA